MKHELDMLPEHKKIVLDILAAYLPPTAKVSVIGSRVNGKAKQYSDLDLVVDLDGSLSLDLLAKLKNAFDESLLPYKVDLIDWHATDQSFRVLIENDRLLLFPES